MIKIRGLNMILPALISCALLQSCGKPENQKTELGQAQALTVELVPEAARAGATLRAIVKGAEEAAYHWEHNGEEVADNTGDTLQTKNFRKGDKVKVAVLSNGGQANAESVLVNSPPSIRSIKITPAELHSGVEVKAAVEGFDPDGDTITYEYHWFVNGQRDYLQTGPAFELKNFSREDTVTLKVTPFDGTEAGEPLEAKAGKIANTPPKFVSTPPADFSGIFVYIPKVTDPDGDSTALTLVKGPEGMRLNDGRIEWNAKGQKGSFEIIISADDGNGGQAVQSFEMKVAQ
ncbi:MAG: hypothetical protein HYS21_02950 [Deltaproteobacteria bacterium]|nr:hypothetical protein [Deltaproteobacteria bacterium]